METWKDIPGYEGIYEASNAGKVRTKEGKTTYTERHGARVWKQRELKQKTDKLGYKRVSLWKDGKHKTWLVHRLVAITFIPNPEEHSIINHKDTKPGNNHVENLEWCDHLHNVRHAFKNHLHARCQRVILTDQHTGEKHEFHSLAAANRFIGRSKGYLNKKLKKGLSKTDGYHIQTIKKEAPPF